MRAGREQILIDSAAMILAAFFLIPIAIVMAWLLGIVFAFRHVPIANLPLGIKFVADFIGAGASGNLIFFIFRKSPTVRFLYGAALIHIAITLFASISGIVGRVELSKQVEYWVVTLAMTVGFGLVAYRKFGGSRSPQPSISN